MIGERWKVSDAEVARRYPCDELVPHPAMQLWRGISVDAPPSVLWQWVRQLSLAPYSYDWLDNLGRRSPRELRPIADPRQGDPMSRCAGRLPVGRVLSVVPGEHVTGVILGATMSYVIAPDGAASRLLLKIVAPTRRWYTPALALGDWPMARRQLLNFKELAEG